MTWLDMITMTVAALSALECIAGRLAPMHRDMHKAAYMNGYLGAACACILSASLTFQGIGNAALDLMAGAVFVHLVLTWRDWRDNPPHYARRDMPPDMRPSRIPADDWQ